VDDSFLDVPAYPLVKTRDCARGFQRCGLGTSREPELIKAMPPLVRTLLAALCSSDVYAAASAPPLTLPTIHREYNSYASLIHLPPQTKDGVRGLADQAAVYMLLVKQDDSLFGRRKQDPDKVAYRLNCSAVNMLRSEVSLYPHLPLSLSLIFSPYIWLCCVYDVHSRPPSLLTFPTLESRAAASHPAPGLCGQACTGGQGKGGSPVLLAIHSHPRLQSIPIHRCEEGEGKDRDDKHALSNQQSSRGRDEMRPVVL
jgi:hypothetical protein